MAIVQHFVSRPRPVRDLAAITAGALLVFAVSVWFDIFNKIVTWMYSHDTWRLDELFTVTVYLVFAIGFYSWRRHRELVEQTRRREKAEAEKAQIVPRLEEALASVSRLKNLVPMCGSCKRIRDDQGYWDQVEAYVELNFATRLDVGICPDCAAKLYGSAHLHHDGNGRP